MKNHKFLKDELDMRMGSGEAFTYGALCAIRPDEDRSADARIQKWRRKGWISFRRDGRKVVWSLTPVGLEATAELRSV